MNVFVYFVCYGVVDWVFIYLVEEKSFIYSSLCIVYVLYEWVGILGIFFCGWMSDKLFKGCRVFVGILFMVGVFIVVFVYWLNFFGNLMVDSIVFVVIGFLIYGLVMLIGLYVLDLVLKKVVGIVVGLIGFFGYLGGVVFVSVVMGFIVDVFGWDGGFILLFVFCVFVMFFFVFILNIGLVKLK